MSKHKCPHIDRPIFSHGRCKQCALREDYTPLKRTPIKKKFYKIRKVSRARSQQIGAYQVLKEKKLKETPECEINLSGCTIAATQVHHAAGREGDLLTAYQFFKSSCDYCHTYITEYSAEAITAGHSISRHVIYNINT